jgi:UDP-3-O-[3-hydroxymyristoyl] glucosamine N-acyltransferase
MLFVGDAPNRLEKEATMTVATLGELGELVQGTLRGQANTPIRFALPLNETLPAECITLVDKVNAAPALTGSAAAAAIVPTGFPATDRPVIEVHQPHAAFERIIAYLRPHPLQLESGVAEQAYVHPTARLGRGCIIEAGVSIGAHCVLGDRVVLHSGVHVMASSSLGDDCEIFPGVVLYPETRVGSRVIIHGGAVLGAYGFGYKTINGRHERCAQLGWVEIGDDVEIGGLVKAAS